MKSIIELKAVHKHYGVGNEPTVHVLKGIDFTVGEGAFVAVVGASGSGKSTLLNILGCLDRPSEGSYHLDGEDVSRLDDDALSRIRNRRIGFIFQSFHLIPQLTVLENVNLPLYYAGVAIDERNERSKKVLNAVGLGHRLDHRPSQLSGGECQRAAIARSLVNEPRILLADEPTGNLDSKTGTEILGLVKELHAQGRTVLMITHDPSVAAQAQRIVRITDGRMSEEAAPVAVPTS